MGKSASVQVSATASRPITFAMPGWAFAMAAILVAMAMAPVVLRSQGQSIAAIALAAFFSKLCHQHADRSLVLFGSPMAVCMRCLGIYAGAALGSLVRVDRWIAIRCVGAALACNLLDVATESLGLHGNMPLSRLLIGAMLGITVGIVLAARPESAELLLP